MSVDGFLPFFDDFFGLLCVVVAVAVTCSVFGFAFVFVLALTLTLTLTFTFALVVEFFECTEPDFDGLELRIAGGGNGGGLWGFDL